MEEKKDTTSQPSRIVGAILIILGILLFTTPLFSAKVIGTFAGVVLLLAGISHLFTGGIIRSIFYILGAILILSNSLIVIASLPILIGIFLIIDGIIAIIFSFAYGSEVKGRWWIFTGGIFAILFAIIILSNLVISLVVIMIFLAIHLVISGIIILFSKRSY